MILMFGKRSVYTTTSSRPDSLRPKINEALLNMRVIGIWNRTREAVAEHGARILEPHSMLLHIRLLLSMIPFKREMHVAQIQKSK
jgi:hypothetical protein